tara:strand:- start:903 stop:1721 length:819 start_codon:yes stop_codon:yes gene_type:complete
MKLSARFPEDLWQIQNKEDRATYNDQVKRGYDFMPSLSFCVVGLARNIETEIALSLDRIEALRQATNLYWVVYTNDNDDKTREVLQDRRTKKDVLIYEELDKKFHGSVECENRYADMAYYRNKYLEHIEGTDYTIVLDLDTDGFSYDGVAQSIFFMETGEIDCVGSNSLLYRENEGQVQRLYYDTLAFRRSNRQFGKPHPGEELNLMNFNRGEKLLKVQSCFGGLAIYKTESLQKYKYLADDCDHVTINRHLPNVYMNPSQIVLFGDNPYAL